MKIENIFFFIHISKRNVIIVNNKARLLILWNENLKSTTDDNITFVWFLCSYVSSLGANVDFNPYMYGAKPLILKS